MSGKVSNERFVNSSLTNSPSVYIYTVRILYLHLRVASVFWSITFKTTAPQYQSIPKPPIPPRAIPGHLTRVKLRTVGNLTQNEARPVGHLTFVSKRLSAVGNKRISQFFDSARAPRSRVIALVDSTWVFLLLSFLYRGICLCLKCGAKTS